MCLLVKLLGIGGMDVVILAVGVYQMVSQPIVSPSPGILKAFEEVVAISKENNVSLRIASYMLAIKRITTAAKLRGGPVSMD